MHAYIVLFIGFVEIVVHVGQTGPVSLTLHDVDAVVQRVHLGMQAPVFVALIGRIQFGHTQGQRRSLLESLNHHDMASGRQNHTGDVLVAAVSVAYVQQPSQCIGTVNGLKRTHTETGGILFVEQLQRQRTQVGIGTSGNSGPVDAALQLGEQRIAEERGGLLFNTAVISYSLHGDRHGKRGGLYARSADSAQHKQK